MYPNYTREKKQHGIHIVEHAASNCLKAGHQYVDILGHAYVATDALVVQAIVLEIVANVRARGAIVVMSAAKTVTTV